MQALLLDAPHRPLRLVEMDVPVPGPGQVLLRVEACAVCRTDLHIIDGELGPPELPLILGHEVIGHVVESGSERSGHSRFEAGQRVGVPWLGSTCGKCRYCRSARENLCPQARFTGFTINGGFAEYAVADERFCFPVSTAYSAAEAAPLLCAGLIGYRSLVKAGDAKSIGIYGFGAAAHIVTQVAIHQGRQIHAFTRPGDTEAQSFALELGAVRADGSDVAPPDPLDAAIIFAPVGELVPLALRAVAPGGTVVCGGIHMSQIPAFPYAILWEERTLCSVANLTRRDGEEFMALAPEVPVRTRVETFPLAAAEDAIDRLRRGAITGAAVLVPDA